MNQNGEVRMEYREMLYEVQACINGTWETDQYTDSKEQAEEALRYNRKFFRDKRWRIVAREVAVIWERD